MNPFQKRPGDMPGLGSPSGMDAPPPLPSKAAPPEPDAGGSQAEMTCPTCGDKITVTLAPAEPAPDDQGGDAGSGNGSAGADTYQ